MKSVSKGSQSYSYKKKKNISLKNSCVNRAFLTKKRTSVEIFYSNHQPDSIPKIFLNQCLNFTPEQLPPKDSCAILCV